MWELGFNELHKSYLFGGHKEYPIEQVAEYLQVQFNAGGMVRGMPWPSQSSSSATCSSHGIFVDQSFGFVVVGVVGEEHADGRFRLKHKVRGERGHQQGQGTMRSLFATETLQ